MAKVYTAKEIQKLIDSIPKKDDAEKTGDGNDNKVEFFSIGIKYSARWLESKPRPIGDLVDAIVQVDMEKMMEIISSDPENVTDCVNRKDDFGFTPLMAASALENLEAAELLLDRGAKVDERNNQGATALIIACQLGGPCVEKRLIERGADVNAQTIEGYTPLIISGIYGTKETVEILINAGADPSLKDMDGCTALMRAEAFGNVEAIEVLKREGERRKSEAHC